MTVYVHITKYDGDMIVMCIVNNMIKWRCDGDMMYHLRICILYNGDVMATYNQQCIWNAMGIQWGYNGDIMGNTIANNLVSGRVCN